LPLASANGLQTKAHKALAKIRRLSVILFLPNSNNGGKKMLFHPEQSGTGDKLLITYK
jgi:hypothetical protein